MRKISTADFIAKAHLVHGNRYDYSPTVYQGNKVKVEIICPEHGVFTQTPANHNFGFGCINCGFKNAGQYHKKDTKQFIQEAHAIHGERYDYSSTQYRGAREKLTIICLKHGPFLQTSGVHLRGDSGSGCELCSYELRGDNARMKFEEFVRRAVEIHADAFDYSGSKSSFIDATTNVTISCLLHGPYQQTPINHLNGQGCPRCSRIRVADGLRKTNQEFVQDSKTVHGEKYDYSQCDYAGAFEAVTVICPIDGAFTQSPTSHLAGIGCPRCSRRAQGAPRNLTRALRGEFDKATESFVYVVRFRLPFSNKQIYKIGSGTGTRLKTVSSDIRRIGGLDIEVQHHAFSSPGEAIVFEHLAHEQVMAYQFVIPPEYKFHGHTEVFAKEPDLGSIERHLVMLRFRAGARWDPRKEHVCDF